MEIVEADLAQFIQECSNIASYNSWIIWDSIIYNMHMKTTRIILVEANETSLIEA